MVIIQAGLYPKNYSSGMKGHTKIPCFVCGQHMLRRLRVIRAGLDGSRFILHVCERNLCLRSVVRELSGVVEVRKIRTNSSTVQQCSRCSRDARGGVIFSNGVGEFKRSVNLCELCLLEAVQEAVDVKRKIATQGGID